MFSLHCTGLQPESFQISFPHLLGLGQLDSCQNTALASYLRMPGRVKESEFLMDSCQMFDVVPELVLSVDSRSQKELITQIPKPRRSIFML